MFHRVLSLSLFLALAPIAACTDVPDEPTDEPSTTAAARSLECVELGYGFDRPHRICILTRDEGTALSVATPQSCPRFHSPNVCGDQCCDREEANLHGEFCARDCLVGPIGVLDGGERLEAEIQLRGVTVGAASSTAIIVNTQR